MKTESMVRVLAGILVLASLTLAHFFSPWWLALAAFVGVNLIQSAFTNFCLAEIIIRRLGLSSDAGRTDQRAAHP